MSWGSADHTHDYAERSHQHWRGDIGDVADQYHTHDDLADRVSVASSDCRDSRMELWERIDELEGVVTTLRKALTMVLGSDPEVAVEKFMTGTGAKADD